MMDTINGYMDLAQKRIGEAMQKDGCSESDIDARLGLRLGTTAKVLAGEPGMRPYAERIALELGADNQPADDSQDEVAETAVIRLKSLKEYLGVNWAELSTMLGYKDKNALPRDGRQRPFARLDGIFQAAHPIQGRFMPTCRHPEARKRPS